jgi:hypothetical protein
MSAESDFLYFLKLHRTLSSISHEKLQLCEEIFRLGLIRHQTKNTTIPPTNRPPGYLLLTEDEMVNWQKGIESDLQVVHDRQMDEFKQQLDAAYTVLAELTFTATGHVPAYGTDVSAENLEELKRIFTLGRHFEILLKAKANHPMLQDLWDQFTMALRLCGEDEKE